MSADALRPRRAGWGAVAAALLAAGCASAPTVARPSIAVRSALHRVAVNVSVDPSMLEIRPPPSGGLEGAGEGAAAPFRSYWQMLTAMSDSVAADEDSGSGQGVVFVAGLALVVMAVGSAAGTVYGAFATVPEKDVQEWIAVFRDQRTGAGPDLGLAEALRRSIAESGTPVRPDDGSAADATLDVVLRDPVIVCEGVFSPTAFLVFEADAELRPAGAAPVPLGRFRFVSGERPFRQWSEAPSPIADELRLGARQVAEAIADYALRLETKDGR